MEKIYIKNKNMFKNKWQMIIYMLLFVLIIYLFIYIGTKDYNDDIKDNERFAQNFSKVSLNNVFVYGNANDVRMAINGSNSIILFGTKNEWVNYYASIVNNAAIHTGVDKIIYYDFLKNRQENNGTYEDIVKKLSDYCTVNDRGKVEIYAPTLVVIKNDKVLYFDSETAFVKGSDTPDNYWNMYKKSEKTYEIEEVFNEYMMG